MARLGLARDDGGAVYVEFLLAFLPIFLLSLAICQAAFVVAGRMVVNHAALVGARSAIVVLEDDPRYYAGAERGWVSDKPPKNPKGGALSTLAQLFGTPSGAPAEPAPASAKRPPQQGERMQAIRRAALRPLTVLAPTTATFLGAASATLRASLERDGATERAFAQVFVEAAGVVTIHGGAAREELAAEPIARTAPITVRVTFVQLCGIPVVRGLMCRSLSTLLDLPARNHDGDAGKHPTLRERLALSGMPGWLEAAAAADSRFVVFEAEVTLPNQGAAYDYAEKSDDPVPSL